MPSYVNYIAQDRNGTWNGFREKPHIDEDYLEWDDGRHDAVIISFERMYKWRESLQERP